MVKIACSFLVLIFFCYPLTAESEEHKTGGPSTEKRSVATPKDPCSLEGITNNCAKFTESGPEKIIFPDGTFVPNYAAIRAKTNCGGGIWRDGIAPVPSEFGHSLPEGGRPAAQAKLDLIDLFDEIRDKIHPKFSYYLLADRELLSTIFTGAASEPERLGIPAASGGSKAVPIEKGPGLQEFLVPWPANNPRRIQRISLGDIKKTVWDSVSKKQLAEIQELLKQMDPFSGPIEKMPELPPGNTILDDLNKATSERIKHVEQELIEDVRRRLIAIIKNGKAENALSDAERDAIKKVETIRVTSYERLKKDGPSTCQGETPNAFYQAVTHTINICPNFYNFPDVAIAGLVAHEMMHSIDPCHAQFGLYEIDEKALAKFVPKIPKKEEHMEEGEEGLEEKGPPPTKPSNSEEEMVYEDLKRAVDLTPKGKRPAAHVDSPLYYSETIRNKFIKAGVLKVLTKPWSPNSYPFRETYECLKRPEGGAFRSHDAGEMESFINKVVEHRQSRAGSSYNPAEDKKALVAAFNNYPDCISGPERSQMGECVADLAKAAVMGEIIKERKRNGTAFPNEMERLASVGFQATLGCLRNKGTEQTAGKCTNLRSVASQALEDYRRSLDEHPHMKKRLEKIILKNKDVREAFGCDPNGAGPCDLHIRSTSGKGM